MTHPSQPQVPVSFNRSPTLAKAEPSPGHFIALTMQLIYADNDSLNLWRQEDPAPAIAIFSRATRHDMHHRLANRSIVRTRLKQWQAAEQDARQSIKVKSTTMGHIALSIALSGQGNLASAKQAFNQAFLCDEPKSDCLLLLIKSIIIFVGGEPDEAMRRVTDLAVACEEADKPLCRAVQAQIRFLVGMAALHGKDNEKALKSFSDAGDLAPFSELRDLDTISLLFGWDFDWLLLRIRQWRCEALYAASKTGEAKQSLETLVTEFGAEIKANAKLSDWLRNFSRECTKALQSADDIAGVNGKHGEAIEHHSAALSLNSLSPDVEVAVTGQSLLATTTSIIQSCPNFRLLIIGISGVGKSSLINKVFGVEVVHLSEGNRGRANIDQEFISPNSRIVVHDSPGFEAGDERNIDIVTEFVARRKAMPQLKDRLHAIWLCLEIPYSGGRLLEAGPAKFLQRRKEILGNAPLVVVLTKMDLLDMMLEIDLPEDEDLECYKSDYMDEHCIRPLHNAAGSDVTHVTVSTREGYAESLSNLFRATEENMVKNNIEEEPRLVATIAQRVSIKDKIESSVAIGKKKYWKTLLKSAVFGGHTLKECLQVIRQDVITVWNFDDPDNCLLDDDVIGSLLRTDNLDDASDALSNVASGVGTMKAVMKFALSLLQPIYSAYGETTKDVKVFMAYTVDLVCVMQIIFLVAPGGRVTADTVTLALQAYQKPRKIVHLLVDTFDGKLGVLPGGRDYVLEKIEELIWRYNITDHEIEQLKRRINEAALLG